MFKKIMMLFKPKRKIIGHIIICQSLKHYRDFANGRITINEFRALKEQDIRRICEPIYEGNIKEWNI